MARQARLKDSERLLLATRAPVWAVSHIQEIAARRKTSVSAIVGEAVTEYLDRNRVA